MFVAVMRLPEPGKVLERCQPQAGSCAAGGAAATGLLLRAREDISNALQISPGSEAMLCFPIVTNSLCASPPSSMEPNLTSKNPPIRGAAFLHLCRSRLISSAVLVEWPSGQQLKMLHIHLYHSAGYMFAKDYRAHVL